MSGKEWASCCGNSNFNNTTAPEEWSVHAQLTFTPQAGNIVLTTSDGGSGYAARGDSGYSSERVGSPRCCGGLGLTGARATCSVTVAGHHTVTLTCSEIPEPPTNVVPPVNQHSQAPQQQQQQQQQHNQHFCFHPPHPPPEKQHFTPLFKDAASQTSTSQVPLVVKEQSRKPKPVTRSPARVRGSPLANKSPASSSEGMKNPRTVHIDVYCTGSDSESSSSSEEDTISTPQTVFESSNMKVLHTRANGNQVPHALQRQKRQILSNSNVNTIFSPTGSQSNFSTAYPSPRSSLVSGFDNFSIPSESTISSRMSVENSSSVTTSWKDTDIESTRASLKENDSFEYDNSLDKLRIKQKEKIWGEQANTGLKKGTGFKNRSPPITVRDDEDSSSSTSSDESDGLAWSFGRYADLEAKQGLKREDTVRRANSQSSEVSVVGKQPTCLRKSGSLSDSEISPSGKKSYKNSGKPPPIKYEHWSKAQKFGPVVGSLKKPGHHVGPSKNPDCSCDTCRYFFEHICYRNRTRSLGDNPS
ncbi:uncharacterized protein LOC106673831 [Cimex lectularius]|uniref:Uncharacterized protein n=1 Tax=Cimex lectularius TaxID=79782 RepID=A0A8I6TLF5_CIMLE|nr:uncharacterized protein LOC106673831 [Cimex lectularius]